MTLEISSTRALRHKQLPFLGYVETGILLKPFPLYADFGCMIWIRVKSSFDYAAPLFKTWPRISPEPRTS